MRTYTQEFNPFSLTTTLYKEDFSSIRILPSQPARTQLVPQLRGLLYKFKRTNRMCFLIPSLINLSEHLQVEKDDILYALNTLRASGYDVECPNDSRSIYLFPNHLR